MSYAEGSFRKGNNMTPDLAEKILQNNLDRFNRYTGKPVKGGKGKKKKEDKDQQILDGFKLEYYK